MPPHPRVPPSASATLLHPCRTCGRHISPRRKWAAPQLETPAISYCSHSCRIQRPRPGSLDVRFEEGLMRALKPSESLPAKKTAAVMVDEVERETVGAWRVQRERSRTEEADGVRGQREGEGRGEDREEGKVGGVDTREGKEGQEGSEGIKEPKNTRERCRRAARRLAVRGEVVLVGEDGKAVVDGSYLKGRMGVRSP